MLPLVLLPAAAQAQTILVLGDSLSAAYNMDVGSGWTALLQRRLDRQKPSYRVVNASVSGDTTAGGVARLPKLLAAHRPAIVIVGLGGNDGLRGLPPDETKQNLARIVSRSKAASAQVLLLGVRLPPNYGTRYNERFRQVYRAVAAEQNVALVPFVLNGIDDNPALMQADGIHPNARAQAHILENVWQGLQPLL